MPQFTNQSKIDSAFKFSLGVLHSNSDWNWFGEKFKNEVNILTPRIWASTPPFAATVAEANTNSSNSDLVEKVTIALTMEPDHNGRVWRARSIPGNSNSPVLTDSISPLDITDATGTPSRGYEIGLYEDDGSGSPDLNNKITTTEGSWAWHYKLCVLILDAGHTANLENSGLGWKTPIHAIFYRYTGTFGFNIPSNITVDESKSVIENYIAGEDLLAEKIVIQGDDNKVYLADYGNMEHVTAVVGITLESKILGSTIKVLLFGRAYNDSWSWDINKPLFLGSSGNLTTQRPLDGFLLQVAQSCGTNSILFNIKTPTILK